MWELAMLLYSNETLFLIDITRIIIKLIRFYSPDTLEAYINILIGERL